MCGEADNPENTPRPFAVIDETVPFVGGGVCYAVVSGIVLADEHDARAAMRDVIPPTRRRPFHWREDGPVARERALAALDRIGVLARAVLVPCGRQGQERARATALAPTIEHLLDHGCQSLVIETRTPAQDGRDRAVVLDIVRPRKASFAATWEPKSNELLWIAEAIGGAVHDHLVGARGNWFDRMVAVTGLELDYRSTRVE